MPQTRAQQAAQQHVDKQANGAAPKAEEQAPPESQTGDKRKSPPVETTQKEPTKKAVKTETEHGIPKASASAPKSENNKTAQNGSKSDDGAQETLETGIFYFFFRPRVELEDPKGIQDVQRSYILLRPLKQGSTLPDGPLKDAQGLRLLALPKKTLPGKGDRFLAFVEKAKSSTTDLNESFLTEIHNETKTKGYVSVSILTYD
jgi:hypothetical protein